MAPLPCTSASVNVVSGAMDTDGESFQPWPRSRAAFAPVPLVAMPPLPFSPVKFSALIERVRALDKRDRLPRCMPRPSKRDVVMVLKSSLGHQHQKEEEGKRRRHGKNGGVNPTLIT